jgi:putative transposon-encoded protein
MITGRVGRFGNSGRVKSGNISVFRNSSWVKSGRVGRFGNNGRVMTWHASVLEIIAGR